MMTATKIDPQYETATRLRPMKAPGVWQGDALPAIAATPNSLWLAPPGGFLTRVDSTGSRARQIVRLASRRPAPTAA
jgi:hypothetical protein